MTSKVLILAILWFFTASSLASYPAPKGRRTEDYNQQYISPIRFYQGTVKQVHIIFRHGDRAPIGTYPNDPNKNYEWPFGRAQLTDVGKRQHYELGTYLRNRYAQLLTTDPREVLARSSDKDRCLASMQTNLAAFYRPNGKWVWNRDLPWQPIPIHTAPGETDWLLNEDSKCPAAEAIKQNVMKSSEGIRYAQKYQFNRPFDVLESVNRKTVNGEVLVRIDMINHIRLFEYVTQMSGKTVNNPSSVLSVHGITFINKLNNLTIPEWVNPIWDEFTRAADEAFIVEYSSKPLLRMRGGPLIGHIVNHMKKYGQEDHNAVNPKVFMYATHDAMIAAFLNAIGVFNGIQVPYAGTVLMELHEHLSSANRYTVRMYYRNTTAHDPYQLVVPNCLADCPLADFERLLHNMIPKDIREECYGPAQQSEHQRQELLNVNSQCCCCNQCGSHASTVFPVGSEKLTQGSERSRMQELLFEMRQVMEQHKQSVDRAIQELVREMEDMDQGIKTARATNKESSGKLSHYNRNSG